MLQLPFFPLFLPQLFPAVAVEQLPEGRGENAPGVQKGEAHGVEVLDLLGLLVHPHPAADAACHHAEGHQRAADHIEVLSQAAEGHVHVLIALAEYVHRNPVVAVVLVEVDGLLGKGFIVAVVILDARLVNNHLCIFNHVPSNVQLGIELVSAGDGDVAVDGNTALEVLTVEDGPGEDVLVSAAKSDYGVFMEGPAGEVGGEGGLAGAWDAEVYVEYVGMGRAEERAEEHGQIAQARKDENSHRAAPFKA